MRPPAIFERMCPSIREGTVVLARKLLLDQTHVLIAVLGEGAQEEPVLVAERAVQAAALEPGGGGELLDRGAGVSGSLGDPPGGTWDEKVEFVPNP